MVKSKEDMELYLTLMYSDNRHLLKWYYTDESTPHLRKMIKLVYRDFKRADLKVIKKILRYEEIVGWEDSAEVVHSHP